MTPRTIQSGFTLLELVLVMVIIATAVAAAAPSLNGWSRGSRLRDSGDQFLASAKWARTTAISQSRVHRMNVDASTGRWWMTQLDGQEFIPVTSGFGKEVTLSEGFRIQLTEASSTSGSSIEFIDFFPTGRTTPGRAVISDDSGSVEISAINPAEGFRIIRAQEEP